MPVDTTARAQLVDEAELLREIESGRIEAAQSPFRDPALRNVTISPHAAGHAEEGMHPPEEGVIT